MDINDQELKDINPSITGPQQISGTSASIWTEIERQATIEQDPKASALLEIRKSIKDEIHSLRKTSDDFRNQLKDYQNSLKRTDNLLIGIVVVVCIAFITTISLVFFDLIKEKDLYFEYNKLYQEYSEKNSQFKDIILEQKIDLNNLQKELELLRAKNSYLK